MPWTLKQMPDCSGQTALVTGANTGIGYETARALAAQGAQVILACRSRERGEAALAKIRQEQPQARLSLHLLDLSSLAQVRRFASEIQEHYPQLHLLINNAGVMMPPRGLTEDGFELQIGVNYLGHFLLTQLLQKRLEETPAARVITLSSIAHRRGQIDLSNFRGEKPYRPMREYAQSKLACLIFALELDRRLKAQGSPLRSLASHPGWTYTELARHSSLMDRFSQWLAMPTAQGALPTLYAAVEPLQGGEYIGPDGFKEIWGYPALAAVAPQAQDQALARRLWQQSEEWVQA